MLSLKVLNRCQDKYIFATLHTEMNIKYMNMQSFITQVILRTGDIEQKCLNSITDEMRKKY